MNTRLVLGTLVFASLATACTAIVLGKVSDYGDYKVTDSTNPGADTDDSGVDRDACSLLSGNTYSSNPLAHPANDCSKCIAANCANDVTFACNGGTSPKPWFQGLKSCAIGPYQSGYTPPGESVPYGCRPFEKAEDPVSDNGSDTQREVEAHNCVTNNCVQGATPPCKQCLVNIEKSDVDRTKAYLSDDACGKLFTENCQDVLVRCCDEKIVSALVTKCAFTNLPANKAACRELRNDKPDAGTFTGSLYSSYDDASVDCYHDVINCFQQNYQRYACN